MKPKSFSTPSERSNFYKELFSLAVPIGLQNLLVALIGASDALMLGRRRRADRPVLGQRRPENGQKPVLHDPEMVLWHFTLFWALAMFVPQHLMRIYTPDQALIEIGASYLRAVSFSYLFSGITQCYYLVMKLEGKAQKSVIISVVTLVTDVALDYLLIYGAAGAPKLGANGSAYTTVVVELVALVWCIAESHRGESIRPDWQGFKWFSAAVTKD